MASAANTTSNDGPITVISHMKIQPTKIPRFIELCNELIADIEATEPAGSVKYHIFRNDKVEDEMTIVESFTSRDGMKAWWKKPVHEQISAKSSAEGLIEPGWETRYCSRLVGTKEWD